MTALLKSLLLIVAILVVAIVAGSVALRDEPSRHIEVQIDTETEGTLRSLGSDLDIRQALVDALNERLHGVKKIVRLQGLEKVVSHEQADAFSFRPFGIDVSTSDITRMMRTVKGSPAPMAARVDLMCAPRPCTEAGVTEGQLVVTLSGPRGGSRVSYRVPLVNPALRRSLHKAMQRTADLLLDLNQPLVASIFFLNRQDVLPDELQDNLSRAEGSALRSRTAGDETNCMVDLVIGVSLIRRNRWPDGIAAEERAAGTSDVTCQVQAWTNIVFSLAPHAFCSPWKPFRDFASDQVRRALKAIPKVQPSVVGDLVYNRIPTAQLDLEILDTISQPGHEKTREAFCNGATRPPPDIQTSSAEPLAAILQHTKDLLPPGGHLQNEEHFVLELLRRLLRVATPIDDPLGRLLVGRKMKQTIDIYLLTDRHPRLLFLTQGKLAMDLAWAAHDALALTSAEKRAALKDALQAEQPFDDLDATLRWKIVDDLASARVAFENAAVTDSEGKLVEPSSDIGPLVLLGDALLAAGDISGAESAYMRAVDAFAEGDEEASQLTEFAGVVARWAALRVANGACATSAVTDPSWEQHWARLGGGPHDICAFDKVDKAATQPSILAMIRPIVADAIERCVPKTGLPSSWQSDPAQLFALVDCLHSARPDVQRALEARITHSAAAVDSAIERALNVRPAEPGQPAPREGQKGAERRSSKP